VCLAIPGRVVELGVGHEHLARVEVNGATRTVNIGLLEDEGVAVGEWVLIHVGFAMSKIDEAEAARALEALAELGRALDEELEAMATTDPLAGPRDGEG
jgi:hydrogenase expression/formation protein HypC